MGASPQTPGVYRIGITVESKNRLGFRVATLRKNHRSRQDKNAPNGSMGKLNRRARLPLRSLSSVALSCSPANRPSPMNPDPASTKMTIQPLQNPPAPPIN